MNSNWSTIVNLAFVGIAFVNFVVLTTIILRRWHGTANSSKYRNGHHRDLEVAQAIEFLDWEISQNQKDAH